MYGMPKDPQSNGSSNGTIDDAAAEEAFVADQRARIAEVRKELAAEGVDSTKERAMLRARVAAWQE